MQHVNLVFRQGEKGPILVVPAAMNDLTDFMVEELALRGQRTPLRKKFQRTDRVVNAFEPAVGRLMRESSICAMPPRNEGGFTAGHDPGQVRVSGPVAQASVSLRA